MASTEPYEDGLGRRMSRREFGLMVGAAVTTAPPLLRAQPAPASRPARPVIKAHTFNHLAMAVTDVQRTADWYQRVFGTPVRFGQDASGARIATLRIADGPEFLELIPVSGGAKPGFHHLGFGVQSFNRAAADQALSARNLKGEWRTRKASGADVEELVVRDPDDLQIQIQDTRYTAGSGQLGDQWAQGWTMPSQANVPPLAVRCINHATFGSASKERVEQFYLDLFDLRLLSWDYRPGEPSKILGFVSDSPRSFIAPGQGRLGISHYCLGVDSFDRGRVVKVLTDLGVPVRPAGADRRACCGAGIVYSAGETAFVADPDGISVQITDANYCAGAGPIGVIPAV